MTVVNPRKKLVLHKIKGPASPPPAAHFSSKSDLLSVDLKEHIGKIYEYQKDKAQFFSALRQALMESDTLDFSTYGTDEFTPFREVKFAHPVIPYTLPQFSGLRIAAIDGGLAIRQHLGMQFSLVKAAVVIYEFKSTPKPEISYFPPLKDNNFYQFFTDIGVFKSDSGSQLAGLRRCTAENQMVLQYLTSTPSLPDVLILDGSVLPPPAPIFQQKNPTFMTTYTECVNTYISMYKLCEKRGILLVGSVKDTFSTSFRDILLRALPGFLKKYPSMAVLQKFPYRQFLENFTDCDLMYSLLPVKTRSLAFLYRKQLQNSAGRTTTPQFQFSGTPFGRFLQESRLDIYASYLQISKMDEPLRLEFIAPQDNTEINRRIKLISALLYPLSAINPSCTLPLPQIEAHNIAHLPDQELDIITNQLEREFYIKMSSQSPGQGSKFELFGENSSAGRLFWTKRHDRMDSIF